MFSFPSKSYPFNQKPMAMSPDASPQPHSTTQQIPLLSSVYQTTHTKDK